MKLKDIGEFKLIQRITPLFNSNFPKGVEGIGNDCAVIPFHNNQSYLVTTDLLNENVHFIQSKITPFDLGYKSLAVNLSDIAAMGGQPKYAFLSLGFPPETSVEWVDDFFSGFRQLAEQTSVLLLGGDTTRSNSIVINVLLVGEIETSKIKRRSQALVGDIICCTSFVGDSGAGLKILLEKLPTDALTECLGIGLISSNDLAERNASDAEYLIKAHTRPRPHLEEGAWLSEHNEVHAMMDLSDGITSDIQRIMEQSNCGAQIEIDKLPLSQELKKVCQYYGWNAESLGLSAGEDYCLLLTVDKKKFHSLQREFCLKFGRPLYEIGEIISPIEVQYTLNKKSFHPKLEEFNHFK